MPESGTYCIAPVPDGHYYLLAAALALSEDPIAYLLTEASLRGSASQSSLLVRAGQVSGHMDVTLRPTQLTDPPILVTLPLLLPEWSRYRYQDCRLTYRGRWQGMHAPVLTCKWADP